MKKNVAQVKKELVIGKKDKPNLSKAQQTFNRLVKRLEKLRTEMAQNSKALSEKLDYYGKHIHPLEQDVTKIRIEIVKTFYKFHQAKKPFSKKDKEYLLGIMASQMNDIFKFNREELDDELKEIFKVIEGRSLEEAEEESFDEMKADMEETFKEMGVDIDLDSFDKGLSQEEMMRRMMEIAEEAKSQFEAKEAAKKPRKKTAKQIAKEEREKQIEEAKSKNISTIYKQLARMFHPDLEQNEDRKAEKEALMKELTSAYEKGDLHTLLRLELEWIQKEESNLDKLSDEKLSIYNEVLREQVREIEEESFFMMQHPRYQPLRRFVRFGFNPQHIFLDSEKRNLENTIKQMKADLAKMQSENGTETIREIINLVKNRPKPKFLELDLDDLEKFFR